MIKNDLRKLIISVMICEVAGVVGLLFTISAIPDWCAGLVKTSLNPPSWVFGPAWTTLYLLMGVAVFLIWKKGLSDKMARMAVIVFGIQLFLNAIWSIIFFGLHNPLLAFVDIVILWFAIVWTILVFYKVSKTAAYLLVPYIIWVSFAAYLNYSIWQLNPSENSGKAVFCTQEAKLCSDGSYVGRTGPKCEFSVCPKEDLIVVQSPMAFEKISSPVNVKGKARGTWFFEASFPVRLVDENGKELAIVPAQAKTDWMTTDFVEFEAELYFSTPTTQKGYLVFEKDNPSGLPEYNDQLKVPISFDLQ